MPKAKMYIFVSIICLLVNTCAFVSALIDTPTTDIESGFLSYTDTDEPENLTSELVTYGVSSGLSFLPFASIVSLVLLGYDLPTIVTVFSSMILGVIGAVQLFLIAVIVLNLLPKVLGSGFDV